MKKLLLVVTLIVCGLLAKAGTDGYRIIGKAPGVKKAMAYLIVNVVNVPDTIARAEVIDGKFELKGKVSEVMPVNLTLGNQSLGGVPVYLENMEYRIEINPEYIYYSKIEGGGEAQRISDKYRNIDMRGRERTKQYVDELNKLEYGSVRYNEVMSIIDSLRNEIIQEQNRFMEKYADSYLNLDALANYSSKLTAKELKEKFSKFSPELQKSFSGRTIANWINKLEHTDAGEIAPDFTVQDPEGNSFNFYSVKAKVKLLDFWASWCSPCRAMIPDVKKLYDDFHDKGFEIVSISMDKSKKAWLKALEDEKMPWKQGCDFKGADNVDVPLMKAYAFWGVPYLFLIDENNHIIMRVTGGDKIPEVRAKLESILGK